MTETSRPLDALNKARNKKVIVELKNGSQYIGVLKAFDIHINTVLNDAEERENIKSELDNNLDELQNASRKVTFDRFLAELKEAL